MRRKIADFPLGREHAPLREWKIWLEEELAPPRVVDDEVAYILGAFLDLIKHAEKLSSDVEDEI